MIKWKRIKRLEIFMNRPYLFIAMRKWWVHSNVLEGVVRDAKDRASLRMARIRNWEKKNRNTFFMLCPMSCSLMQLELMMSGKAVWSQLKEELIEWIIKFNNI